MYGVGEVLGEGGEIVGGDQGDRFLDVEAVDDQRRIGAVGAVVAPDFDEGFVVVDCRFGAEAADDAESAHGRTSYGGRGLEARATRGEEKPRPPYERRRRCR